MKPHIRRCLPPSPVCAPMSGARALPRAALLLLLLAAAGCTPSLPSEEAAPRTPDGVSSATQALFTNGGFEDGTLTGWTVQTNQNLGITYPPASITDLKLQAGGTNKTSVKQAPGGPETLIPAGLTSAESLRVPRYGNSVAVVNELGNNHNVNSLVQQSKVTQADVDPADGKVHVRFAIAPVLQNPNHTNDLQPYFYIQLRNVTNNQVLWTTFNFANQAGVPWKTATGGAVQYTDWQSVDVAPGDARLAVDDTLELTVIAAGCGQTAHWGHVYVDGFGAFLQGLSIAASAPQSANADSDLTYTYTAKNTGATPTEHTTVTLRIPANTTFVSINAPGATCTHTAGTPDSVTCDLGTLNPNANANFQVTVHINPTATGKISHGDYDIHADSVSPLIGPLVETALTTNATYADLSVTLTDGVASVGWGQTVHYTLVASNAGPNAVTGATITDTFPAQLTGISWTCAGASGGTCGSPSGTGNLNATANLPVGGQVTYSIDATVVAGSGTGTLKDTATIAVPAGITDSNTANNTAVDTDGLGIPVLLTVNKDPAANGSGTVVSSPAAINCGPACTSASANFLQGTQVTLTPTAATGSTFTGWSGACTGTAACTVTLAQAAAVTATFTLTTFPITTTSGEGGTVTCPPRGDYGKPATCTVTPSPGYVLATLGDNGTDVLGAVTGGSYTIPSVTGAHTVGATFKKARGTTCGGASECATGLCVDGVCCNAACDGQCEACNAAGSLGTCSAVTGAPHAGRAACGSDGSVCGLSCDGTHRATCSYPGASVSCQSASCSGGASSAAASCNGAGACAAAPTQSCGLYQCGDDTCRASCQSDGECTTDAFCVAGECKAKGDGSLWKVEGSGCSSTGGSLLLPLAVLSAVALLRRRKVSALLAGAAVAVLPVAAQAQAQAELSRSFLVERFAPQPGSDDILGVQSARVGKHLDFNVRLFGSYADKPLRLVSTVDPSLQRILLDDQTTLTLTGALSLFNRVELGAAIPLAVNQYAQPASVVDSRLGGGVPPVGFSDLRLSAKAALIDGDAFGLAVSLPVTLPTGHSDAYLGGGGFTFSPTVIGEYRGPNGLRVVGNAGVLLGRGQQFLNLELGTALSYGVGGKVDLVPKWNLALLATLAGELGLTHPTAETSPLELLAAVRWTALEHLEVTLGGGPGLTNGYGTPRYRLIAALGYVPGKPQPVAPVTLPVEPAPAPLVARDDEAKVPAGETVTVPVLANDAGTTGELLRVTGATSANGGRVEVLPDGSLRYTPKEGFSGKDELTYLVAGNGGRTATARVVVSVEPPPAPPLVARDDTAKVTVGQTVTIPALTNDEGAPGEPLRITEATTANGGRVELLPNGTLRYTPKEGFTGKDEILYHVAGNGGRTTTAKISVTVEPKPVAVVEKGKIFTIEKVYFATDKAEVLPVSLRILDEVAKVMVENPSIHKVRIEAHTDNAGNAAYNKQLSARRAKWVLDYLVGKKGIAAARLDSAGFGMTKPIDTNATPEGRANNRRVEFVILQ